MFHFFFFSLKLIQFFFSTWYTMQNKKDMGHKTLFFHQITHSTKPLDSFLIYHLLSLTTLFFTPYFGSFTLKHRVLSQSGNEILCKILECL